MGSLVKGVKEDLSIEVIERMFVRKERTRVVIAPHPIHGKASACVPYLDLSEGLTCPPETIYSIISRSERVKKYCGIFIMKTPGGIQPTLCIFEEGVIHVIMKLQPSRCQNPEVGNRLDEVQDEMVQVLRDVLHGYYRRVDHTSVATAKTLAQLISVANKTTNKEYLDILNQHIESLSGQRVTRCRQLTFNFNAVAEVKQS